MTTPVVLKHFALWLQWHYSRLPFYIMSCQFYSLIYLKMCLLFPPTINTSCLYDCIGPLTDLPTPSNPFLTVQSYVYLKNEISPFTLNVYVPIYPSLAQAREIFKRGDCVSHLWHLQHFTQFLQYNGYSIKDLLDEWICQKASGTILEVKPGLNRLGSVDHTREIHKLVCKCFSNFWSSSTAAIHLTRQR